MEDAMNLLKSLLMIALLSVFASSIALAANDAQSQLGLQIGNVSLTGDVTNSGLSNGIGYGAFYDFAASDMFELDLGLLYSSHTGNNNGVNTKLTQTDADIAAKFVFANYDVINPYGLVGVDLISRSLDLGTAGSGSGSGFGLDFGLGADLMLSEQWMAGLLYRYVWAFEQTTTIGGNSVKIIQPFNVIVAKLGFRF